MNSTCICIIQDVGVCVPAHMTFGKIIFDSRCATHGKFCERREDPIDAPSTNLRADVETSIDFILEKSARMDDLLKKLRATHSH